MLLPRRCSCAPNHHHGSQESRSMSPAEKSWFDVPFAENWRDLHEDTSWMSDDLKRSSVLLWRGATPGDCTWAISRAANHSRRDCRNDLRNFPGLGCRVRFRSAELALERTIRLQFDRTQRRRAGHGRACGEDRAPQAMISTTTSCWG